MKLATIPLFALCATAPAQLTPVPFEQVKLGGPFWGPRLQAVAEGTVAANFHQCEITGRLSNFARAAGREEGEYQGYYFNDSDVYKAIEGACYVLAQMAAGQRRDALDDRLDTLIATIAAAQRPDGYINSYYTLREPDKLWTDTAVKHEMYCIGHLIEAGVAHHRATDKRSLLDVAIAAADHVDAKFGPPPKRPDMPGHEEIELALVKLWRLTGEARYLKLARHLVDTRGVAAAGRKLYGDYCQDHAPLREQEQVRGHAVRAMYLYSAAADLALHARDDSLVEPMERLWHDLVHGKMYVTGGIGNSRHNEGFTDSFDLPNESAYAETCATIGLCLWNWRLNLLHGESRFYDVFERALYNGMLSGLSLDGTKFFYVNPLASKGDHHRRDWYACACCPPNILRFLASIGDYAYATTDSALYVNLYAESELQLAGTGLRVVQRTRYPWDGEIGIWTEGSPQRGAPRDLMLRIPDWCESFTITVDGEKLTAPEIVRGYARIPDGCVGAHVVMTLRMPVRRVDAHPGVTADRGRVALQRGPLVYCLEDVDNGGKARRIGLPADAELTAAFDDELLGGVVTLTGTGFDLGLRDWDDAQLYRARPTGAPLALTAIPYFAWDNRQAGAMEVWVPETPSVLPLGPRAGVKPSASHCFPSDSAAALTDRREPDSSADHSIPRHTFWPQKGTTEWLQLDFDDRRKVSGLDVYWFDDGPPAARGGCRVPGSWRVLFRRGDTWQPVQNPRGLTVDEDRYNQARFDPVTTTALRIEVDLQEGFSGGVLECRAVR